MNQTLLNGLDFFKHFKCGAENVIKASEVLNRINVFPVRDGDTGTNLSITLSSILNEAVVHPDLDLVVSSMSDVALENARGNSGIIFASFIEGFSEACHQLKEISPEQFVKAASHAVSVAYQSVRNPQEGTILTVMRAWEKYLVEHIQPHVKFNDMLHEAYKKAELTLEETQNMMQVLKKNKVVDSGAKGFVLFLEGFLKAKSELNDPGDYFLETIPYDSKIQLHEESEELNFRYCTEFILKEPLEDTKSLDHLMDRFGDSLIITGNQRLTKIHVHTNAPDQITLKLHDAGHKIYKSKVEDMWLQNKIETHQHPKIGILTDSICDISDTLIDQYQIHFLPLAFIAGESTYLDKYTISSEVLKPLLDASEHYPSSSQVDVKLVKIKLEWMLRYYEEVVVLSVSKALSGTYEGYKKAIEALGEHSKRITLLDTKLNSGAQGLVVLKAAQMASEGQPLNNIIETVKRVIGNTKIFVSLDTFKYATKSGRVPYVADKILTALHAKPIMTLDEAGFGKAGGIAFSRDSANRKIYKKVMQIASKSESIKYAIVHADNIALAERFARRIEAITGQKPEYMTSISAITAIHAGIGSVAVCIVSGGEQ